MRKTKAVIAGPGQLPVESVYRLCDLSHRLSNQLEVIIQCQYLLKESSAPAREEKWTTMLGTASEEAVAINREIRETLQSLVKNMENKDIQKGAAAPANPSSKLKKWRTLFVKDPPC